MNRYVAKLQRKEDLFTVVLQGIASSHGGCVGAGCAGKIHSDACPMWYINLARRALELASKEEANA